MPTKKGADSRRDGREAAAGGGRAVIGTIAIVMTRFGIIIVVTLVLVAAIAGTIFLVGAEQRAEKAVG